MSTHRELAKLNEAVAALARRVALLEGKPKRATKVAEPNGAEVTD